MIDGRTIQAGDQIIGITSNGVHSNGFSLVRRVLAMANADASTTFGPEQLPLVDALLAPTQLYGELVKSLLAAQLPIHGMAHITGGGIPENLPRCLPKGLRARISPTNWPRPELFKWLQQNGEIPERDLWHTFNMGIGFCLVLPDHAVSQALSLCQSLKLSAWQIGDVQTAASASTDGVDGLPA